MNPEVRMIGLMMPYDDPDYPESLGFTHPNDLIEYAGRWDYGADSVAKMGELRVTKEGPVRVNAGIIERWLDSGEESMVEMGDAVFLVTCSRVVTHEMVRHRVASYQQESQRFVKYDREDVDSLFLIPPEVEAAGDDAVALYRRSVAVALDGYIGLKDQHGVKSQIARYLLPNATRTRIIVKMNLRELRHVLRLRMHTSAQPEFQVIARLIHGKLQRVFGAVLVPDDIAAVRAAR